MASSSKVQFKLSTLRQKALEAIDFRIRQRELELASYDSDEALEERVSEWRKEQEARLSDLFRQLETIDNYHLSKFRLDPIPTVDRWERNRTERDLTTLRSKRTQIEAKADSLVPDADGNIALTKTQLSEFFGL